MKKKYIIELLIKHFEKYNSKYFTENIIIDNINYHKYFKCLLKKDLLKIYETVSNDLESKTMRKKDKLYIVKKLGEHFDINTTKYFIDVINSSYYDNIKYSTYLKCLSKKNIDKIFININKNIEMRDTSHEDIKTPLPQKPISSLPSVSIKKPATEIKKPVTEIKKPATEIKKPATEIKKPATEIKKPATEIKKPATEIKKPATEIKKPVTEIKKPAQNIVANVGDEDNGRIDGSGNIVNLDFNKFDTVRKANKKYEDNLDYIVKKYKRKKSKIIKYVMKLTQLFLNEIIVLNDINNRPIKIRVINELYRSRESLLYIGKVIEGDIIDNLVVLKIQPRLPQQLKKNNINILYQIIGEQYVMKLLNINCANAIVSKVHAYGNIGGLVEGDIERYILVTNLLGNDLTHLIGDKDISKIKRILIQVLRALQSMHNCNLNKNISIIHRDIKPNNIVYSNTNINEIKMIDFGLSVNILNNNGTRYMKEQDGYAGTLLYMATMLNKNYIIDYMDDIQSVAWVLLDLLCDKKNILTSNINIKDSIEDTIYNNKMRLINNYRNIEYIKTIESDTLTANNISVIGEIANYTIGRANKPNKYSTDKITDKGIFYTDYNDAYYNDIELLLNKLS